MDERGGDEVAVMDSARVLGAAKVIAIDKEPYRLETAGQA